MMTTSQHVYEVRPRCAAVRWVVVCRANATSNAIGFAKFFSRSHDAVIRVYDEAGNVIGTPDHKGDFREW
jgi:hypothetical protein